MGIFPDMKVSVQQTVIQVGNTRKSIKADMEFISHTVHLYMHKGRGFAHEVASQKSDHGGKSTVFRILAPANNIQ